MKRFVVTEYHLDDLLATGIRHGNCPSGYSKKDMKKAIESVQKVEIPEKATHVCWQDEGHHWVMAPIT